MTDVDRLEKRLARERKARREAELITEGAARDSYDREQALALLADVARAANEAQDLEPALEAALRRICGYTGWPVGHAWLFDEDAGLLRPSSVWVVHDVVRSEPFRIATEGSVMGLGDGVAGTVAGSATPWWSEDVTADPNFKRAEAAAASGLHGGFAFPVRASGTVVAVLEFFTDSPSAPDPQVLDLMVNVGAMLGQVVERVQTRARLERLAAALASRNEELQRSNTELEAFAYAASHDLSEPLRMVTSYLRLLQRRHSSGLDTEGRQLTDFAVGGIDRMRALIDALLDFSRAGRAPLALRDVDTKALVEVTLQGLQARVEETDGVIEIGELPHVHADPVQLGRVFQNLIANGLKFAREGVAPEVVIAGEHQDDGWRFEVCDNGIGIDPRHSERVFEMFHRLHSRDTYDGTGLGLALCQRVVERHGGRIWVEPGPSDVGSRFVFTLPSRQSNSR
jgi:signal transduction histidine kinase